MYEPQALYEASYLGDNKPEYTDLGPEQKKPWEQWAQAANDSTFEGLVDDNYVHDFQALTAVAFRLATSFIIAVRYDNLPADWGGPDLSASFAGKLMPLKLDSVFHVHHQPDITNEGLVFTTGFDQLYRIQIPWDCIHSIVFVTNQGHPNTSGKPAA